VSENTTTRRRLLQLGGSTVAVTLAGCSGLGGGGFDGEATPVDIEAPADIETPTARRADEHRDADGEATTRATTDTTTASAETTFRVRIENVAPTDSHSSETATTALFVGTNAVPPAVRGQAPPARR